MKMAFRHIQNDCVLCHANKVKDVRPLGECLHITANFWLYVRLLHLLPSLSPPPHLPDQQEQIYLTGYQHGSDSFAKQTFTSPQIALRDINGDGGLDLPVTSSLSAPPAQVTPLPPTSPFLAFPHNLPLGAEMDPEVAACADVKGGEVVESGLMSGGTITINSESK